jgi:hypothetical protein
MMCTEVGGRPWPTSFGAYEAREQRERASAMFEQLAARVDMSPGQRALAIDLMLAFARAEIMTPAFFPKGHGEAN